MCKYIDSLKSVACLFMQTVVVFLLCVLIKYIYFFIFNKELDSSLFTSAAAIVFAYHIFNSNHTTKKISLFQKRLDLYNKLHDEIEKYSFYSEEFHNRESLKVFRGSNYREVKFLFGDDVLSEIVGIHDKIKSLLQFTQRNQEIRSRPMNDDESQLLQNEIESNVATQGKLIQEISLKLNSFPDIFKGYLDFSNIK